MFKDYLLMGCLVVMIIVTIGAIAFSVGILIEIKKDDGLLEEKNRRKSFWDKVTFILGIVVIVCSAIAYRIYQYLILETPMVLQEFGIWYLFGFLSRVPLLYYKDYIFHPVLDPEWGEIFKTFFTALLGPMQIPFTFIGIRKHKPWH